MCGGLPGVIGGVHLLPIYPSSGDGGFAPLTYGEVDPHFGTWEGVSLPGLSLLLKYMNACQQWAGMHKS